MADLNPLELRNYAFAQGTVINQDDLLLDDDLTVPSETRQCAVGDLTVQYYRAGETGGRNTEEVVTVLQGDERVYEAVYDSFDESGEPTDFSVGLSDLSPAQLESLQQAIALQQSEPQIKGFATMQDSYVEDYGPDAALVATVFALGERGELFDQWLDDNGKTVNSSFYRVPNSTLVVNQVGTFGEDESYFVLDVDEPLFEVVRFGYAGIKLNNLSLSQVETLKTAQREGANPLLIGEAHFETGMGQLLTNDGQAQARAILSQGDSITPAMVAELNELMAIEEDIRRQDQVERGPGGDVSYPRYTVEELNRELSLDTIARQLSAQSPVIDVQAQVVAEAQSQQPVMQSVADYMETVTPENIGSMVYAQYYRWSQRTYNDPVASEPGFVRAGFLVEFQGQMLGSHDPMPFQVIDIATDRVVMDFTLAEGKWVERPQTAAEIEAGEQPPADFTGDTVVVNRLDESFKTRLLLGFEAPHRKANLIASTYLNESLNDEVYLESGLIFQREYDEDGSLWRDLTFSSGVVSSDGYLYALSQAFPDGGGMGMGIPLAVEWAISQEFENLVDEYEATRQATVQPLQQPQELTAMPSIYDRPKAERERMETLAMTLLQSGETLVVPRGEVTTAVYLTDVGQMTATLTAKGVYADGKPLDDAQYGMGAFQAVEAAGVLQAMQDGTLQTADGQPVIVPDLLSWEQLNAPSLNQVEGLGYVLSVDAERAYRAQWAAASDLPLPELSAAIPAIPGYAGGVPTLKQLLDGQQVLLDQAQQSPLAVELLPPLRDLAATMRQSGQDTLSLQTTAPDVQPLRGGDTLEFANPYTVRYGAQDNQLSVYRPGREAAVLTVEADGSYFVDGLSPSDAAFLQVKLPQALQEQQAQVTTLSDERLVIMVETLGNNGLESAAYEGLRNPIPGTSMYVERVGVLREWGPDYTYNIRDRDLVLFSTHNSEVTLNELTPEQLDALESAYLPVAQHADFFAYLSVLDFASPPPPLWSTSRRKTTRRRASIKCLTQR